MSRPPHQADSVKPRSEPVDLSAWDVPHQEPFLCDITISPDQLSNTIEHVSNIEYVRWLDRAAELHADHLGFTRQRLLDEGRMWFVVRHEVDYLAEVWRDDRLIIATWVRDIRRVKSWRDYVIVRPDDGQLVCRGATLWVLVDLATRRPVRIPHEMASAFDPLLPGPLGGPVAEPSAGSLVGRTGRPPDVATTPGS